MAIAFYQSTAPWSNDWGYEVKSFFGDIDADESPAPRGSLVSIKADSDEQAERRVIDYATQNFGDDFYGDTASSDGPNGDGTYTVRIVFGS